MPISCSAKCDQRRFAQVVGAGLEGQADEANLARTGSQHFLDGVFDVDLVGGQDAGVHGQIDIALFAEIDRGAQVLGQTRAAEGIARLQVGLGDVELGVAADQIHDLEWDRRSSASHRRAVSLANVIFSAWKLLQQYLTISAERTLVR